MKRKQSEIEIQFNTFVKSIGGILISELIGSSSPEYDNADYLFDAENVIAELKVIETNHEFDPNYQRKVQAKVDSWMEKGEMGIGYGMAQIDSHTLSESQQWELARIRNEPIRRAIKKANRQIRETKDALNKPDAKGLLILINEADRSQPPEHLAFAIHQSLHQDFSNIHNAAILTVNLKGRLSNIPTDFMLWMDYDRNHPAPISQSFLQNLQKQWISFLSASTGESIPLVEGLTLNQISKMNYK